VTEQYATNVIEANHGRLKARLRPMRGLKCLRSARTIAAGHACERLALQRFARGSPASTQQRRLDTDVSFRWVIYSCYA
jgi:transposase-like protein